MNSAPCKKVLAPDAFALGSAAARRRLPIVGDVTPYPKVSTDRLPALIF